jgi:amino acid transporter
VGEDCSPGPHWTSYARTSIFNQYFTWWKLAIPVLTFLLLFFTFNDSNFTSYGGFTPMGSGYQTEEMREIAESGTGLVAEEEEEADLGVAGA